MHTIRRAVSCAVAAAVIVSAQALAAYQPHPARDHIARDLASPETWRRFVAAEFLLELGDSRGIPGRIDAFEMGGTIFPAHDVRRFIRRSACRDLRAYSQQSPAFDPDAGGDRSARSSRPGVEGGKRQHRKYRSELAKPGWTSKPGAESFREDCRQRRLKTATSRRAQDSTAGCIRHPWIAKAGRHL